MGIHFESVIIKKNCNQIAFQTQGKRLSKNIYIHILQRRVIIGLMLHVIDQILLDKSSTKNRK